MENRNLIYVFTTCVMVIALLAIWTLPEEYFAKGTTPDGQYLVKIFWSSVVIAIGYPIGKKLTL
ncbi:MAG TPA: hypothetical protein VGN64_25165 [Dyadobacter sp.]|jgi:hypothetical protein|nr:hypothetical protein [Dyadobacter sp.]